MPYQRKTEDEFQIHGLYEGKWEEITAEKTWKEARTRIKEYRTNEPGTCFRVAKKRIPKEGLKWLIATFAHCVSNRTMNGDDFANEISNQGDPTHPTIRKAMRLARKCIQQIGKDAKGNVHHIINLKA